MAAPAKNTRRKQSAKAEPSLARNEVTALESGLGLAVLSVVLVVLHHLYVVAARSNPASYGPSPASQLSQIFAVLLGVAALAIYLRAVQQQPAAILKRENLYLLGALALVIIAFLVFQISQPVP
jgi:hypothetical protein